MLVVASLFAGTALSALETPAAAADEAHDAPAGVVDPAHAAESGSAPGDEAAAAPTDPLNAPGGAVEVVPGHEPEGGAHPGAEHGAAAEHASPNLFTVEPGLMIWTMVTFLVVLLILRVTAWKPLMAALAEREQKIEGAIAEASRIKNEAEQLFAKYQTMIDRAKDESRAILDEARRDGIALQESIKDRAKQEAEEFKTRAQREIELQKEAALKEIWDQTADLSTLLASKVLGRTLQGADQERLVKELLAGVQADAAAGSAGAGASGRST